MRVVSADGLTARSVQAVLFDLDGTMLDTAADISLALNRALAEQSLTSLPQAQVRVLIGRGVPTLIERAVARLAAAGESADAALLLERFHFHYERIHELDEIHTRVYPGVSQGLGALHALGLSLAVVTNKPRKAAVDLLTRLGLARWIEVVVGGDSGMYRKPHPQPLLRACEDLEVRPAQALMVGDSLTDVLAARAAGLAVVCVPYGYNEGADPRALPCDAFVESVGDLPALLTAAGCCNPSP
ncbi:MAG: phosphoglycolate phosphatase [Steroidobacteraceae bacterium]